MGIGKRNFARVTAKAITREKNRHNHYNRTSNNINNRNKNIEQNNGALTCLILVIFFIIIIICEITFLWNTIGLFGILAILFVIGVFKALLG